MAQRFFSRPHRRRRGPLFLLTVFRSQLLTVFWSQLLTVFRSQVATSRSSAVWSPTRHSCSGCVTSCLIKVALEEQWRKLMDMLRLAVNGLNRMEAPLLAPAPLGCRRAGYGSRSGIMKLKRKPENGLPPLSGSYRQNHSHFVRLLGHSLSLEVDLHSLHQTDFFHRHTALAHDTSGFRVACLDGGI